MRHNTHDAIETLISDLEQNVKDATNADDRANHQCGQDGPTRPVRSSWPQHERQLVDRFV